MDKLTLAERLLTPITGSPRACEIVGDLLEEAPSTIAFWFSITRIALAYTWRWLVGIPAAMFSVLLALKPYTAFVVEPSVRQIDLDAKPVHYGVYPPPPSMQIGGALAITAMCLWTVAALTLIRYGVRSSLARLSCLLATLFTVGACSMALPHTTIEVPVLLAAFLTLVLAYATWRRLFLCILATGVTFFLGFMAMGLVLDLGLNHFRLFGGLLEFAVFGAYMSSVAVEAFILSRTTRWLRVA